MNVIRIRRKALSVARMTVTCIAALAMLGLSADATAHEVLLVVPPGFDNVEGDDLQLSSPPPPNGVRAQHVQPAPDFSGLPEGHNTIVSMSFRPDKTVTSFNTTNLHFELRLSTTSAAPGTLSLTFADNVGTDETVVYSGPITWETDGAGGPPDGPRPFDYLIEFQTPFVYDPNQGNLLDDVRLSEVVGGPPTIDSHTTGLLHAVVAGDASATTATGTSFERPVIQFAFVPEPSTFILAALGLTGLLAWRRKKGQLSEE